MYTKGKFKINIFPWCTIITMIDGLEIKKKYEDGCRFYSEPSA
jgi:hypothetical protein